MIILETDDGDLNQGVVRGHVKKRVGSKYISDVELTWFAGSLHTECKEKEVQDCSEVWGLSN